MRTLDFDELKPIHRDVLRLMAEGRLIKQIAGDLGIAEVTVNQRLTSARTILKVSSSHEAARLFADFERNSGIYRPPIYSSGELPDPSQPSPHSERTDDSGDEPLESPHQVAGTARWAGKWLSPWRGGREHNDLGSSERLNVVVALMLVILLASGLSITAVVLLMDFIISVIRQGTAHN